MICTPDCIATPEPGPCSSVSPGQALPALLLHPGAAIHGASVLPHGLLHGHAEPMVGLSLTAEVDSPAHGILRMSRALGKAKSRRSRTKYPHP